MKTEGTASVTVRLRFVSFRRVRGSVLTKPILKVKENTFYLWVHNKHPW